jgi:hypothetical protein
MGFFKKRKIVKQINKGMEQINSRNYWDAIRILTLARNLTIIEKRNLEQSCATLPVIERFSILHERGGEGARLNIFLSATFYGLFLAYQGVNEKKLAEEDLDLLRVYDQNFVNNIYQKLQKGEQLPLRYFPSDYGMR